MGLFMFLVIGFVAVIVLVVIFSPPSACQICGTGFKRARYVWTIDGEKKHLCPNCNRRMETDRSKAAMRAALGNGRPPPRTRKNVTAHVLPKSSAQLVADAVQKIEAAKGPAGRRAALNAALEQLSDESGRAELMLEASRVEVTAVLDKVDGLKTKAAKKRNLEAALDALRIDGVPDHLQQQQAAWLQEALAALETESPREDAA